MTLAAFALASGLCALGLGGGSAGSTSIPLTAPDAESMALATTAFLAERLPPAATTLMVVPHDRCGRDELSGALDSALRKAGFALATHPEVSREAHEVRYHLTGGWQDSLILRLSIDGRETTQLYVRNQHGQFRPAGPLTVKE